MLTRRALARIASVFILLVSSSARAEEPVPAPTAAAAPASEADGGRFRFGIDATAGLESVSADNASVSGAMYGADLRLGWQVNNLLAIYAQPHLSFGTLSTSGSGAQVSGATGTFTGTVIGEVTLINRLFAGAGFGYGLLNNPSGPAVELRAGGYPLMGRGDNGIRRKGLMLGVDFRSVFVSGATGILFMGCIGYEAF
jgi:hypothetical protein